MKINIPSFVGARRLILCFYSVALMFILFVSNDIQFVSADDEARKCTGVHNDFSQDASQPRTMGGIALSNDGRRFVVAVDDRGWSDLFAFDAINGRLLLDLALPDPASSVALGPTGSTLAVSFSMRPPGCPHIVLLKETEGGAFISPEKKDNLPKFTNGTTEVVNFSSDGKLLAASLDRGVYVWDISSGRAVAEIEPPGFETRQGIDSPQELVFSPDSKYIVGISGRNPRAYLWNLKTRHLIDTFQVKKSSSVIGTAVFSNDGSLIAVGTNGPIIIWNTRTGAIVGQIPRPADGPISPVAFMGPKKLVVSGVVSLNLWDLSRRKPVLMRDLRPPGMAVDVVFPLSSGRLIGLTSNGAWEKNPEKPLEIRLIEVPSGKVISTMQVPGRKVDSALKGISKPE